VLTPEGRDNPSVVCQTMFAMTGLQQQGIALWYLTYMRFNSSLKIGGGRWRLYRVGQMSILPSNLVPLWDTRQSKYFWSAISNPRLSDETHTPHTHTQNLTLKSKRTKPWCRSQFKVY